ncbi:hypothetical protein FQN50_006670 [Emmonsiellopsis sp. PD_5]|nr:hypothetical protein FQN50_006670 [Emmonsiellopsis sp. PD_5]
MSRGQGGRGQATYTNGWYSGREQRRQQQRQQQQQQHRQQQQQPNYGPHTTIGPGGVMVTVSYHNEESEASDSEGVVHADPFPGRYGNTGGSLYRNDVQGGNGNTGIASRALDGHNYYDNTGAYQRTEVISDNSTGEEDQRRVRRVRRVRQHRRPLSRSRSPSPDFTAGRLSPSEPGEDSDRSYVRRRPGSLRIPSSSNPRNGRMDYSYGSDDSYTARRNAANGGPVRRHPGYPDHIVDGPTSSPDRTPTNNLPKVRSGSNHFRRTQHSHGRIRTNIPSHRASRNRDLHTKIPVHFAEELANDYYYDGFYSPQVENHPNLQLPESQHPHQIIDSRPNPSTDLPPPLPPKTPLPPPSQQSNTASHNISNSPSRDPLPSPTAPVPSTPGDAPSTVPTSHPPVPNKPPVSNNIPVPNNNTPPPKPDATPKSESNVTSESLPQLKPNPSPNLTSKCESNSESKPEPPPKPKTETKRPEQESNQKDTKPKPNPGPDPQEASSKSKKTPPDPESKQAPTQTQKPEDSASPTATTAAGTSTTDGLSSDSPTVSANATTTDPNLKWNICYTMAATLLLVAENLNRDPPPPKYEDKKENAKMEEKSVEPLMESKVPDGDAASSSSNGSSGKKQNTTKVQSSGELTWITKTNGQTTKRYQVRKCKKKEGGWVSTLKGW